MKVPRPVRIGKRLSCVFLVGPLTFALFALVRPEQAAAEPSPSDRAIAERLYDQGRQQQTAGRHVAACESFAESLRLDPGTGTLLNLAACHETVGRLASAWVEFREAVAAIRREARPDRMRYAQEHLSAIEPRLAYLTIVIPESAQGQAPVLTLDGRELGAAAWGVPIPVDAGWHEATAQSGGGAKWRATIKISDGDRREFVVPAQIGPNGVSIIDSGDRVSDGAAPLPTGAAATTPAEPPGRQRRVAAWWLGGAGLIAVGVGGYFGLRAATLWDDRNRACPMDRCTPEGVRLGERADTAATTATWTVVAGAAMLGAAAVLLLLPTPRASPPVSMARGFQSIGVDGQGHLSIGGAF